MSVRLVCHGSTRRGIRRGPRAARADVFLVSLRWETPALNSAEAVLSAAELQRADRGTASVRRRRIALRASLRYVLGDLLSCPPAEVPLLTTPWGRPQLDPSTVRADRNLSRLDVNCSASGDVGLVTIGCGTRVGIDVEPVPSWDPATLDEGWLTPREITALRALDPADRAKVATRAWTAKEAVLKALGSGLSLPPERVGPVVRPDGHPARQLGAWRLATVAVPLGLVATLATSRPVRADLRAVVPRLLAGPGLPDEDNRPQDEEPLQC